MPRKKIDEKALKSLVNMITKNGLSPEGGGINPTEGLTTLYFTRKGKDGRPVRIELICQGKFEEVVKSNELK